MTDRTRRIDRSSTGRHERTGRIERARIDSSEAGARPVPTSLAEAERELDPLLIDHLLVDSLRRALAAGRPYPFVDMRELKPGAAGSGVPEHEVNWHHHGLILLIDGNLPPEVKKHLRVKDKNRVLKENFASVPMLDEALADFELGWAVLGRPEFEPLLERLMEVDYGVLIQHDPRTSRLRRFALTHFRVRVDWPVEDAAESLALELRYVDEHLYEHPEQPEHRAEQLENKLYERYGFHHTVGGRRTAAIVCAQYLRQMVARGAIHDFRIYIGSAEARTLTKIGPEQIMRYALVPFSGAEVDSLNGNGAAVQASHIVLPDLAFGGVGVLEVGYAPTEHARRPELSRSSDNLVSVPFLRIESQRVAPRRDHPDASPLPCSVVYRVD